MGGAKPPIYVEAEYADGYIHREDAVDASHFCEGRNIFHDIENRHPEAAHGKMVRFSFIVPNEMLNVDFTILPDDAIPVREFQYEGDFVDGGLVDRRCVGIVFGWKQLDSEGNIIASEIVPVA